ncbi:MAG TPA: PAS domain-containing protein [Caulobacteraceae bacterium]
MSEIPNPAALAIGDFVPTVEAMPAMVWLGDPDGRCVYLNKAQRDFWGLEMSDIPRFSWGSTLLEEDAPQLYAVFSQSMQARRAFTVTARYRRADGAIRVLETKAEPRFAPNGEFLGMVGINTDITK